MSVAIKKIVPVLNGSPKLFTKVRSTIPSHLTICGISPKKMKPKIKIETIPVIKKPLFVGSFFLK